MAMDAYDIASLIGGTPTRPLRLRYGTVAEVGADGTLKVVPDGQTTSVPTVKCCSPAAGSRVALLVNGTEWLAVAVIGGDVAATPDPGDLGIADWVVAEGTSGAWEYQKFASGRALVWGHMTPTASPYVTDWNGMNGYRTPDYAYPFQWVAEPACGYAGYIGSGFAINARFITTTTTCSFYFLSSSAGAQTVHTYCLMAGRWK